MNIFLRFTILFLISSFQVFSQQEQPYKWYTSDNGELPQNSIKSIVPDKYGFLWLATEDGLVRFDGQQFKVYNGDNIKGLKSNRMKYIKKTLSQNGFYVGNDLGQILQIGQNPELYLKNGKDIHPLNEVGRLYSNHIKISAAFFKLYLHYDILIKDHYYRITPTSISYHSLKNKKPMNRFEYKLIPGMDFFIINNNLYLKSKKEYFKVTPEKLIRVNFHDHTKEDGSIYINHAVDQVFLYADKKLYYLTADKTGLHKKEVLSDFDMVQHKIGAIYYDTTLNILYLGSQTKGFLVIRPRFFKSYVAPDDPVTYSNLPYDSNSVITGHGQIISSNGTIRYSKKLLQTEKFSATMDDNGDIWTLNFRQLYRYKKQTDYTTFDRWAVDAYLSAIYKDENGLLWIGTTNTKTYKTGHLYYIDSKAAKPKLTWVTNLNFAPNNIHKISAQEIMISAPNGLYTFNLPSKQIIKNSVIGESFVRGIYSANNKDIWVYSYNNGLFLVRDKGTTHFPFDKNKYIRSAHCVVEDEKGFMWIPTNKGLFQVSKQNLIDYADRKKNTVYYHYYNKSSGFLTNEFNGGCYPCATKLSNDYIALPSFEGIAFFNSNLVTPILPTNPIYINEARIDDRFVQFNDTLILNRKFSRAIIYINSPFYGNPENLNIEVKLEGAENQYWTKTNENYTISYTSLEPGEYKLSARKLNGFDSKYDYKTITIIVPPAFWQTIWFKVVMLIVIALLIYYGFRVRTKYIRRQNLILERKITYRTAELKNTINALIKTQTDLSEQIHSHRKLIGSITHDIKSPLKYMALTGKYLYENLDRDHPDFQENIKTMYTSSFELFHFVNNLLEYSKIYLNKDKIQHDTFNLHDLINEKIKLFDPIAKSKKITLENNVSDAIILNLNKQLFTIIIHNLLDNAVKNTTDGNIRFNAEREKNVIRITLIDTGVGMNPELVEYYQTLAKKMKSEHYQKQFTKGIGFHIIIELLNLINGTIKIQSILQQGTTITLILKQ